MAFVVIQYPGVVKNVDKALATLGGMSKLSEDHYKVGSIELDYHRDNIYSRSNSSKKQTGTLLIIRARRKKRNIFPEDEPSTSNVQENPVEAEILGCVKTFYQFSSMFDFQYLPMKRSTLSNEECENNVDTYESLLPKLMPQTLDAAFSWFHPDVQSSPAENSELFLPPFIFSRFCSPSAFILGRDIERVIKSQPVALGASLRRLRKSEGLMVQGNEKFPEGPVEKLSEIETKATMIDPENKLQKLFEEKPIWLKQALIYLTGFESLQIKSLLPKYAFYILSGPWGRNWCKYGYDPRKDSGARRYQTIVFQSRHSKAISTKSRALQLSKLRSRDEIVDRTPQTEKYTESVYKYIPGELLPYRQMWYQICDIMLPEAQNLLKQKPDNLTVADSNLGWFKQGALELLREVMKNDIADTLKRKHKELSDLDSCSSEDSQDE